MEQVNYFLFIVFKCSFHIITINYMIMLVRNFMKFKRISKNQKFEKLITILKSVGMALSVPLLMLNDAGMSYKLIIQMVMYYAENYLAIFSFWFVAITFMTLLVFKINTLKTNKSY